MQFKEESPKQYVDIARAPDEEMRPDCPVPFGVAARTVGCRVALLDHLDCLAPELIQEAGRPLSGASHPVRPGHNASRA